MQGQNESATHRTRTQPSKFNLVPRNFVGRREIWSAPGPKPGAEKFCELQLPHKKLTQFSGGQIGALGTHLGEETSQWSWHMA